jgi:hypothetical protein
MPLFDAALRRFSRTRFWQWLSAKIIAHLTFRLFGYPRLPMEQYFDIVEAVAAAERQGPGFCAFVQSDTLSLAALLTRWVTASTYTHAGVLDPEDSSQVFHMKGNGIVRQHLLEVLRQTDRLAIVRFDLVPEEAEVFERRLDDLLQRRVAYDYQLELEDFEARPVTKLYCSELVWHLGKGLVDHRAFRPQLQAGRHVFAPDTIRASGRLLFEHR